MKNMRIVGVILIASVSLTACATANGGYSDQDGGRGRIRDGMNAMPLFDHQYMIDGSPVVQMRLAQDQVDCINNVPINPTNQAVNGALAGALLGAAIGAALGGRHAGYWAGREAVRGAAIGGVSSGVNASMTQTRALANCMYGRGYRIL